MGDPVRRDQLRCKLGADARDALQLLEGHGMRVGLLPLQAVQRPRGQELVDFGGHLLAHALDVLAGGLAVVDLLRIGLDRRRGSVVGVGTHHVALDLLHVRELLEHLVDFEIVGPWTHERVGRRGCVVCCCAAAGGRVGGARGSGGRRQGGRRRRGRRGRPRNCRGRSRGGKRCWRRCRDRRRSDGGRRW